MPKPSSYDDLLNETVYLANGAESLGASGWVKIEELSNNHIKGSFELVLTPVVGPVGERKLTGGPKVTVSEGEFDYIFED